MGDEKIVISIFELNFHLREDDEYRYIFYWFS